MGKGSATPPPAPDPIATSNAQAAANTKAIQESAKVNAVDLFGPTGSVTYDRDANGVPIAQRTSLTPQNQATLDVQNAIANTLANKANQRLGALPSNPYSTQNAQYDPRNYDTGQLKQFDKTSADFAYDPNQQDVAQIDSAARDAVWGNYQAQLNPVFAQQQDQLDQKLADRGIPIDSQAAKAAQRSLSNDQNNIWSQASNQSYLTGHQVGQDNIAAGQQLHGAAVNDALTFNNQSNADWLQRLQTEQNLRGTQQQEGLTDQQEAFNEASAYLQGAPVFGTPNAPQTPTYQIAPAPVAESIWGNYAGQLDAYKTRQQNSASMWSGLGQGAMAGASLLWKMSSKELKIELGDANSFLRAAAA